MNFAEQLEAKSNLKVIEFAEKFLEEIKPQLIKSAEEGFNGFRVQIDLNKPENKEKFHLYSNPIFVEHLNKHLDGVKVQYKKEFVENLLIKGYGWYKHYLVFNW
ncbi:hypothetical protein [Rummeliibacillus stabekisii]|uniref:hypothetical protein n=1 Tax=Rummeliibacillus stabekisii TaxID=241244 RepID=UPI00371D4961